MTKEKQKLVLPKEFSEELAEETGIHIGDGSMGFSKSKGKNHWEYVHTTHSIDDFGHSRYVKNLMKKLYNLKPYEKFQRKSISLVYTKKELILFKKKLGLSIGKKIRITIPKWILENPTFTRKCVRGIVDTDGSLRFRKPFKKKIHSYPHLKITNKSKELIEQLQKIFESFDLNCFINKEKVTERKPNPIYNLNLNGVKNINKYVILIGFSNEKHLDKYLFWKENGFCPPGFKK